uniref:C3H1-type domain-containing protein n=1 Tax=Neobodo designis TaxID=312471 RepID=A0A6U4T014_NEODS|mmetsp:Transcript_34143/g.105511  ORF Transcript_34143/g.105511 Transcript_34143/m.105511 type:complete len:257 (+) Transcript_34143:208-978(+)
MPNPAHGVFSDDPGTIFVVYPRRGRGRRAQLARQHLAPKTPDGLVVLCRAFASGECRRGESECPHAHVRVTSATPRFQRHVMPPGGWPTPDAVPYPRFPPAAQPVAVDGPNEYRGGLEALLPQDCLATLAPMHGSGPSAPAHCAHWLLKGACNMGSGCRFVHAAFPTAAALASVAARRSALLRRSTGDSSALAMARGMERSARTAASGLPSDPSPAPAAASPASVPARVDDEDVAPKLHTRVHSRWPYRCDPRLVC